MQKKIHSPIERVMGSKGVKFSVNDGDSFAKRMLGSNKKRSMRLGVFLGALGGLILLASYFLSSTVLTFAGLGIVLWAIISVYTTQTHPIPEEVFRSAVLASMSSLQTVVSSLGYQGTVVFFHPRRLEGLKKGYIFVAKEEATSIPPDAEQTTNRMFFDKPEGVLVAAPNQTLIDLFEEKIGSNFATIDVDSLTKKLPKIMIEDLAIADDVAIEQKGKVIEMRLTGKVSAGICSEIREKRKDPRHFECPICTTMALILSKVTGSAIVIQDNTGTPTTIKTTFRRLEK